MHPAKIILLCSFFALTISANSQTTPATADTGKAGGNIFERRDKEVFPGGFEGWKQNLNPNVPVNNGAPTGQYIVIVQFVISRDGSVSDIKALTTHGYGMEQEVIRILKKGPKWEPAVQNGKKANVYGKDSVTFVVTDDQFDISTKVPYVLFTNTNNEITIDVKKVRSRDVRLVMPGGTITITGDGKYIVRVNEPGRVEIELYNRKKKKKRRIGAASFEVKDAKGN